jgi:type VI secretion system protein ImpH
MATPHGKSPSPLKDELVSQAPRFAFYQAMRLLNRLSSGEVRVRPELSLGFPASDVTRIEERPDKNGFAMTATFLGLYGVSSPLPAFYTEDLFRDDSAATREFLDILHQRLYTLLFESWKKYRLFIQLAETKSQAPMEMLYALCGLSAKGAPGTNSYALLRYAGLLGGRPRSALGLTTMLTDFLKGAAVEIIPFVSRAVKIPRDQQLCLGSGQTTLGHDTFVGAEFVDRQGKFRVRIGPLNRHRFRDLLQGGEEHQAVVGLIDSYLTDPLEYDFELILQGAETRPVCLGAHEWSRLGLDTTLFTNRFHGDMSVVFPPVSSDERRAA